MTYPARLRHHLQVSRTTRTPFEQAWTHALAACPIDPDWADCMDFIRDHFRAAYNRDESKRGRMRMGSLGA